MPSQCFEEERLSTDSAQSQMQTGSTRVQICFGKQGNARLKKEFLQCGVCSFEQISLFKTQTLIGYFLGEGSQYIPHLHANCPLHPVAGLVL